MSRVHVWNGGGYGNIPDGDRFRYWDGNGYNPPSQVRVWDGNQYSTVWSRSNPLTVHFWPTLTTNIRRTGGDYWYDPIGSSGDKTRADMVIGRFGGDQPYHFASIMQFRGGCIEGHGAITDIIGARPVIKEANIRLNRDRGGYNAPSGVIRFGVWTQAFAEFLPATSLNPGAYTDWDPMLVYGMDGWTHGSNRDFGLYGDMIYGLAFGNSLLISEVTGDGNEFNIGGGTSWAYGRIYGLVGGDGFRMPLLRVTFDVA